MIEPETATRTRELSSKDFPAPAITFCSNLFARDDYAKIQTLQNSQDNQENFTVSELECKYLASNIHWCLPFYNKIVQRVCGQYDLNDLNIVEFINKSALQTNEMFFNCPKSSCDDDITRIFTSFGVCYTYNMQGFNTIFNTKVIHDDFKCYKKTIYDNETDIPWTSEKGYPTTESESPQRARKGQMFFSQPFLSAVNHENICSMKNFKIFIHKPNEILTPFHESTTLKYDEVIVQSC